MESIRLNATGPAVRDVQHRLQSLGYDLGQEGEDGRFGNATATAVKAFRAAAGLPAGESVNQATWSALVDATFMLGDRVLYLRMPHFHVRDVRPVRTALAALGFARLLDGIFGHNSERAVRDFQTNVGMEGDGIVGSSTIRAIERLRPAWQGKETSIVEGRVLGFARAAAVLENNDICVYGTDETARSIAERISNLAAATTPLSQVVSAQSLRHPPQPSMFMVRLSNVPVALDDGIPLVQFDGGATINMRMRMAIEACRDRQARIVVEIELEPEDGPVLSPRQEQHCAITILDALCFAFV